MIIRKKKSVATAIGKGAITGAKTGASIGGLSGAVQGVGRSMRAADQITNAAGLKGKAKLVAGIGGTIVGGGLNAAKEAVKGAKRGALIGGSAYGAGQAVLNKRKTKIFNQNDTLTNFLFNAVNKYV